jgi:hypothetical protein
MLALLPLALACFQIGFGFEAPDAKSRAFPLMVMDVDLEAGSVSYVPRSADLDLLTELRRVAVTDVVLPDGTSVTLDLERVDLERLGFGVYVDGEPEPGAMLELSLTVWRGTLAGEASSDAALSFSHQGCYGWIRAHGELFHLISRPGPGDDWTLFEASIVSDTRLAGYGTRVPSCATDSLPGSSFSLPPPAPALPPVVSVASKAPPSVRIYRASIAIESDFQYFQLFGSTSAALAYMAPLFAYVSAAFEQQVGTFLTYPYVGLYTTPADPWTTGDLGGNCIDMIYEFQAAWAGNIPTGADLGYFLSGAPLGCGAGFIGGLCDEPRNFAVAGNQNGQTPFPLAPHALNIDYYGATHEIGHTFNAIHTHDYCPPLDECAPPGYFGTCQTQQNCSYPGTLMSYCNACGGFGNIGTQFHPQSAARMRSWVETSGCLR